MAESSSSDELRLVLLAQTDDRAAVEALFLKVQASLLRYISGLVGPQAAGDVLQDVFVRIWRNIHWLHKPELFRPWAYRIASRASFEFLKRERRWSGQLSADAAPEELPDPHGLPVPELLAGLDALLDGLSPASRAVLLLHYGQDLPIEDVAAILDINIGTAKSRLAYGLACLRKHTQRKVNHDAGKPV
jgi:RNA polymerase sigma-70 factor (ECF subfamily)